MLSFLLQAAVEAVFSVGGKAVTVARGKFRCPDCGVRLPVFDPPRSWQQFVHGGRVCRECGEFFQMVGDQPISLAGPPNPPLQADEGRQRPRLVQASALLSPRSASAPSALRG